MFSLRSLPLAAALLILPFASSRLFSQTIGLIGGGDNGEDFAAFVISSSMLPIPISPLPPAGGTTPIVSVAINQIGVGLIGGKTNPGSPAAYAAFIAPGSTIPVPINSLPSGGVNCFVNAVALNNLGQGLLAATSFNAPYAAWVEYGSLTPTPINVPNVTTGGILGAALNDSGSGLIGGITNNFQDAYAARVVFDSPTPNPISGLPVGGGKLNKNS